MTARSLQAVDENQTHKEVQMNPEQRNNPSFNRTSTVLRNGRWRPTVDPIERAELFGQLQGVASAKSLIAQAATIAEAIHLLIQLEARYAAQYDGRFEDLDPPIDSGQLLLQLTY
jgi:hypothetical protein